MTRQKNKKSLIKANVFILGGLTIKIFFFFVGVFSSHHHKHHLKKKVSTQHHQKQKKVISPLRRVDDGNYYCHPA